MPKNANNPCHNKAHCFYYVEHETFLLISQLFSNYVVRSQNEAALLLIRTEPLTFQQTPPCDFLINYVNVMYTFLDSVGLQNWTPIS